MLTDDDVMFESVLKEGGAVKRTQLARHRPNVSVFILCRSRFDFCFIGFVLLPVLLKCVCGLFRTDDDVRVCIEGRGCS